MHGCHFQNLIRMVNRVDDLISKQQAIDAFYESFGYAYCDNCEKGTIDDNEDLCGDCHRKYQNWSASKQTIEKVINSLPSAQPKKGKWKTAYLDHESIGVRPKVLYCSECNQCIAYPTNFCPNCGAKMEED